MVLINQYCNDLNFKFNLGNYGKYTDVTESLLFLHPVAVVLQISCEPESPVTLNKYRYIGPNLDQ